MSINHPFHFSLYRSTDGENWLELVSLDPSTIAYVDHGLSRHTPYWYKVTAWNPAGESAAVEMQTETGFDPEVGLPGPDDPGSHDQNVDVNITISYTYHPLSRLTAADYSDGSYFHHTYDSTSNRMSEETKDGLNSYTYDTANRLASVDGVAYTWDNNGNLLSDGVRSYTYNHANRMVSVSGAGTTVNDIYTGEPGGQPAGYIRHFMAVKLDLNVLY